MRTWIASSLWLGIGLAIGLVTAHYWPDTNNQEAKAVEKQPLYWVAPMDANYRRDGPGKSPMGMDLVPVYAEDDTTADNPGAVRISPAVANNLGVRTGVVEARVIAPAIHTVGLVQYDEEQLEHIHPRVAGWVEALYVQSTGDRVEKGQKLYDLYSPDLVYAQEDLLQAVNQGNTRLVTAAEARMRALKIPQSVIDSVKEQRKVLQKVTFFAPKSGVLDNLNVREGFYIEPGVQVMSIAVLDTVWVEAEVFANQANRIHAGLPVAMSSPYLPEQRWYGSVDYVYPSIDEQNRTVRARLRFANPDHTLKPGMYAQVTIEQASPPVLTIPRAAVIRTGEQTRAVVVLDDGSYKSVAIQLGRSDRERFEVLSGLMAGDRVVTSAQFLIDSESSKTSDFLRMQPPEKPVASAAVAGVINSVDSAQRRANISRDAIAKWNRGPATLDFTLADNIDIARLKPGQTIHMVFEIHDGDFVVTEVHHMADMDSAVGTGAMPDHSAPDADSSDQQQAEDHSRHQLNQESKSKDTDKKEMHHD